MANTTNHGAAVAALLQANKGTGAWPKLAGTKPSNATLALASTIAKPGTAKWLALAMYARKGGATQAQVCCVLNGPHLNCWRALPTQARGQVRQGTHFAYTANLAGKPKAHRVVTKPTKPPKGTLTASSRPKPTTATTATAT